MMGDDDFPIPNFVDLTDAATLIAKGLKVYATNEWQQAHVWFRLDAKNPDIVIIDAIVVNKE